MRFERRIAGQQATANQDIARISDTHRVTIWFGEGRSRRECWIEGDDFLVV